MSGSAPVLPDVPEMTSLTLQAFCNDIARQIHTPEEIAQRYGFTSARAAVAWIVQRPAVARIIREYRAIWESEDSLETRIRAYAQHALLEAAPENARIMLDPAVHPSVRIDSMKETAKLAGMVGAPSGVVRDRNGNVIAGPNAPPFAVNIIFQQAGKVENITTVRPVEHAEREREPEIEGEVSE